MRSYQTAAAIAMLALVSTVLPGCMNSFRTSDIRVPVFFPESPDAGPQASAPKELAPPAGNRLALVLVGSGYQEYQCKAGDSAPAWSLLGPDATLYNSDTKQVGTHNFGPIWTYSDGSVVHGKVVASAPSLARDSVPQLLLAGSSEEQAGMFQGVSFVQRLRTVGGLAPDYGCDTAHLGAKVGRQYSAFYLFYKPLSPQ
jgi:hypothetical protein